MTSTRAAHTANSSSETPPSTSTESSSTPGAGSPTTAATSKRTRSPNPSVPTSAPPKPNRQRSRSTAPTSAASTPTDNPETPSDGSSNPAAAAASAAPLNSDQVITAFRHGELALDEARAQLVARGYTDSAALGLLHVTETAEGILVTTDQPREYWENLHPDKLIIMPGDEPPVDPNLPPPTPVSTDPVVLLIGSATHLLGALYKYAATSGSWDDVIVAMEEVDGAMQHPDLPPPV